MAVHKRMAAMRAAKERKRLASGPVEKPPRMVRCTGLSLGIRDDISGTTAWIPLKSARDAFRRITVILKHYTPGNLVNPKS